MWELFRNSGYEILRIPLNCDFWVETFDKEVLFLANREMLSAYEQVGWHAEFKRLEDEEEVETLPIKDVAILARTRNASKFVKSDLFMTWA